MQKGVGVVLPLASVSGHTVWSRFGGGGRSLHPFVFRQREGSGARTLWRWKILSAISFAQGETMAAFVSGGTEL